MAGAAEPGGAEPSPIGRVPLAGAVNFRDLGGLRTSDGRVIAKGRLFRSDSLAELTETDMAVVAALGLRTIYDLRHASERERHPNRFPAAAAPAGAPTVRHLGFLPHRADEIMALAARGDFDADRALTLFRGLYRRFPHLQPALYGRILRSLAEAQTTPALIHCTSGKDRTGFVTAVLLMALGIPRSTIMDDYLITDRYRRNLSHMLHPELPPETVDILLRAHPDYLQESFAVIDQCWGSDEAYLRRGLGLSESEQARLQAHLLI